MAGGGLFDPIGAGTGRPRRSRRFTAPVAAAGLAVLTLGALLAFAALRDGGDRGEPGAVAVIQRPAAVPDAAPPPPRPASPPPPAAAPVPAPAGLPPVRDDQEVEVENGVRVVRPRRDHPPSGGQTLRVPGGTPASP